MRSAFVRAIWLFAFWVVLSGFNLVDLLVGVATAATATWTSLRLLPTQVRFRPLPLVRLVMNVMRQSIAAGIEVAWRILDPRLPLQPGFVSYQCKLRAGGPQNAFCTLTSLLPGTLPCGTDDSGALVIHCLDVSQPVVKQLSAEEELFRRAWEVT